MSIAPSILKNAIAGTLGLCLISAPALADTMDCTRTQRLRKSISSQVLNPFDQPDRQLSQSNLLLVASSKNPEWDGVEMTTYEHADSIAGAGTHSGYGMVTLKGGEKVWVKWEGAHHTIVKPDGNWETPYQGVVRFIGGTGKYKAIRGGGYYEGTNTQDTVLQHIVCHADY